MNSGAEQTAYWANFKTLGFQVTTQIPEAHSDGLATLFSLGSDVPPVLVLD